MKKIWMNYIYSFFCYQYLKKKKDIEILENILFLVQVESIEKYSKPFICYKIYIYNNTIGITYLSDLIRVGKPIDFSYEGIYLLKNFDQYKAIFNKYQSKSKEEIRELVLTVLQNNNLSLKYFEKKQYQNNYMRKKARIKINSEQFPYKSILRTIVLPPLAIGFTFGGIVILHQFFYNEKFQDDILLSIMLILVGLLCFFLWLTYTIKWSQPTKYEIENGFIEK